MNRPLQHDLDTPAAGFTPALQAALEDVVGPAGVVRPGADSAPYLTSFGDAFHGRAALVVRPSSTLEVADVVRLCAEARVPMVPQGGNTGLAGGAQPDDSGRAVVICLDRMRQVRARDPLNDTLIVEAGVTLADVQAEAEAMGRLFPLSLAAEGSCRIGGNIATNAGGTQVLRYGTTRNLVLGLEVVLPDGRIWNGLRALRKDCAGYDMKQMFIGSEGTLGFITAAVLRLFPRPSAVETAMAALPDVPSALKLLEIARARLGDSLSAFELIRGFSLDYAVQALPGASSPFAQKANWYLLVEASGQGDGEALRSAMEAVLETALEQEVVEDAVVATSQEQRRRLWALREAQAEAQKLCGEGVKHDISVPVSAIPDFIARADAALEAAIPGIRPFAFGHVGDGNIHYNPIAPEGWPPGVMPTWRDEINRIVHDVVVDLGGSISAEHGLGQLRVAEAAHYKPAVELEMMRALKMALDPHGLMNPGKVLAASTGG